jgi:transcriptional regulator with XRE-family HTH domain
MTTPDITDQTWVPELTFAARLALVRNRMGWNIKQAALACGIRPQSWRGWELENRLPHDQLKIGRQIAAVTGVDLSWLLDLDQKIERRAPAVSAEPRVVTRGRRRADSTGSAAPTVQPGYRAVRPTNGPRRQQHVTT